MYFYHGGSEESENHGETLLLIYNGSLSYLLLLIPQAAIQTLS